jgi:acyl transferase domain-containing protein/acyl carrier protein
MDQHNDSDQSQRIAIIGMAIRCPGASSVDEFWQNMRNGIESVSFWTDEELREAGVSEALLALPNYVRAAGPLPGLEMFDAEYFKYSAREAEFIDPQQRVFLECSVEALEDAGIDPVRFKGAIGVFAGEGQTHYMNLLFKEQDMIGITRQMAVIGNDKDYLATRTSYKLGLRGPSMTVQCACSTSTAAVHLGIQSLLSHESDVVLAGGVSVTWIQKKAGYHYVEGGIFSQDGHTRTFDANATGTIFSDGVAIVVLKRLEDAIADGDNLHAIILGSAANNDGSTKVSFTAPSIDGQSGVIAEALAVAGVSPDTIGYIEAHGTGTALGDPIEIEALQQVFRAVTNRKEFCAIASLKSNLGHLNTVAGLAGLIKAARCVKEGEIPPSLHFDTPNPKIDFANSPFYVPTTLVKWPAGGPRRAGISSFGIGGTNTEIIIEEPPSAARDRTAKSWHVAIVSAKSAAALDAACKRLAQHLRAHPQENVADVCHTLAAGRSLHPHACAVICASARDAADALDSKDPAAFVTGLRNFSGQPVAFLFPGQGSQHINMGRELYNEEPVFRNEVDFCAEILNEYLGTDIRNLMFPAAAAEKAAEELLRDTQYAQPTIFVVSYALAKLWMSFGVRPVAALGHSIGEFVAACLAEVFSLENALQAVVVRGRLMQALPAGSMLAIMAPAAQVEPLLKGSVSIAAINTPNACVASGPKQEIAALDKQLQAEGISSTPLHTSHAFHSPMMEPAVEPLVEIMRGIELKPPQLAFISNITGEWITDEQATDPAYWGQHLRAPVQFHKGLSTIHDQMPSLFLEVGPGRALTTLARSIGSDSQAVVVQPSLAHPAARGTGELKTFLRAAAELWLAGVAVDWSRRYEGERRLKLPLPTYPFQRQRYWILTQDQRGAGPRPGTSAGRPGGRRPARPAPPYLMETVTWRRVQYSSPAKSDPSRIEPAWLVFSAKQSLAEPLVAALRERGGNVTVVEKGGKFRQLEDNRVALDPNNETDLEQLCARLIKDLGEKQRLQVVYLCDPPRARLAGTVASQYCDEVNDKVNAPIVLIRSLMRQGKPDNVTLTMITANGQDILGTETVDPMMAMPIGPCLAGMREYPGLQCRMIDVLSDECAADDLARRLAADLADPAPSIVTAYRGRSRWARAFNPIPPGLMRNPDLALRKNGIYLITGGLGDLGLAVSRHLAEKFQASLVLTSRTPVPPREEWEGILATGSDEDRMVRMVRGIQQIENIGGKVMVGAADASDLDQMRKVVQDAYERFGAIHGVIHAAGISGSTPIGLKTPAEVDQVLRPKILGLAVLEQIFADRELDFFALFSSVAALWGREGQVDYAAANAYLDSYAIAMWHKAKWPVVSINWDTWRQVGMAINTLRVAPGQAKPKVLDFGLATAEGIRAFTQALVARHPQVISRKPGPIPFITGPQRPRPAGEQTRAPAGNGAPAATKPKAYPRPALATPYRAPATELETAVSAMWIELLRTSPIGLDDNFFELGGHSLLALQLLPRLREKYQIMLEPREFFANPTVAKLVALVEDKLLTEIEEMARQDRATAGQPTSTAAE